MEKKEAFEVVLAMIAAGKIPMPAYDNDAQKEWASDVRACIEIYVRMLMKAPEPKL